jgi:hypothetical protein
MIMETLDKAIIDLLNSQAFSRGLFEINEQFYYLKQEMHIRDLLLKNLNKTLNDAVSIAEYPRGYVRANDKSSLNLSRRDIGVFSSTNGQFDIKAPLYSVEIKFHYPLDLFAKDLDGLGQTMHHTEDLEKLCSDWKREICDNQTNCLIVIICERDWLDNASVSAAANRDCPIDLSQEHSSLRKQLATYITGADCDFNRALRTSIKSPSSVTAEATTRYTFLVLFRH